MLTHRQINSACTDNCAAAQQRSGFFWVWGLVQGLLTVMVGRYQQSWQVAGFTRWPPSSERHATRAGQHDLTRKRHAHAHHALAQGSSSVPHAPPRAHRQDGAHRDVRTARELLLNVLPVALRAAAAQWRISLLQLAQAGLQAEGSACKPLWALFGNAALHTRGARGISAYRRRAAALHIALELRQAKRRAQLMCGTCQRHVISGG